MGATLLFSTRSQWDLPAAVYCRPATAPFTELHSTASFGCYLTAATTRFSTPSPAQMAQTLRVRPSRAATEHCTARHSREASVARASSIEFFPTAVASTSSTALLLAPRALSPTDSSKVAMARFTG